VLAVSVVPVEPCCEFFGKFGSGFVCFQVDPLVLQGTPEAFDEDVVFEPPFTVHADLDVPGFEDGCERLAGKLAPLVAVEDLWGSPLCQDSCRLTVRDLC